MVYETHRRVRNMSHPDYRPDAVGLDDIDVVCRVSTELLRPHRSEFDAVLGTGLSGISVAPTVAMRLRKKLLLVRKSTSDCHGWCLVVGSNALAEGARVAMVDDFCSSGETVARVVVALHKERPDLKLVLFASYNDESVQGVESLRIEKAAIANAYAGIEARA